MSVSSELLSPISSCPSTPSFAKQLKKKKNNKNKKNMVDEKFKMRLASTFLSELQLKNFKLIEKQFL